MVQLTSGVDIDHFENHWSNRLLFIDVTFVVHATAWLTLPDRKQPSVFDIDAGVRVQHWLHMLCFTDISTFLPDDRIQTRNHRKKTKADGSRLIPRKHTETLVLLSVDLL